MSDVEIELQVARNLLGNKMSLVELPPELDGTFYRIRVRGRLYSTNTGIAEDFEVHVPKHWPWDPNEHKEPEVDLVFYDASIYTTTVREIIEDWKPTRRYWLKIHGKELPVQIIVEGNWIEDRTRAVARAAWVETLDRFLESKLPIPNETLRQGHLTVDHWSTLDTDNKALKEFLDKVWHKIERVAPLIGGRNYRFFNHFVYPVHAINVLRWKNTVYIIAYGPWDAEIYIRSPDHWTEPLRLFGTGLWRLTHPIPQRRQVD